MTRNLPKSFTTQNGHLNVSLWNSFGAECVVSLSHSIFRFILMYVVDFPSFFFFFILIFCHFIQFVCTRESSQHRKIPIFIGYNRWLFCVMGSLFIIFMECWHFLLYFCFSLIHTIKSQIFYRILKQATKTK